MDLDPMVESQKNHILNKQLERTVLKSSQTSSHYSFRIGLYLPIFFGFYTVHNHELKWSNCSSKATAMLSFGQGYARYAVGTSAGSVCLEAGGVLLGPVGHRNKHQ